MWDKVVKKTIDVKAKASLQPPFRTNEIDSIYPRGYKPLVKKNKDDANWKHQDGDKNKAKSHNLFFANTSHPLI